MIRVYLNQNEQEIEIHHSKKFFTIVAMKLI